MTLLEEAALLFDEGFKCLRRGRDQAAADYFRQARKLYEADVNAVAEENLDLAGQVEALQVQLDTLREQTRIRDTQHNQHVSWTTP